MGILNFTQINIIIILSTLIILLLRFIFRRNFSANFRMILWLLFLIRLLLPIGSIQQNTISSVSIRINSVKFDAVAVYENIIKTIYLIIAFAILLIIIFRHFKVINLLKISLPFENKFIDDWKNNIKDSFGISIRTCEFINSPLTYGFFNPVILLPDYDQYSNDSLNCILTHEYIHIQKCHMILKWIFCILSCIYWVNPIMWVVLKEVNKDIELSCDEHVLKKIGIDQKKAYVKTILEFQSNEKNLQTLTNLNNNELFHRMEALMNYQLNRKRYSGIFVCLCVAICFISSFVVFGGNNKNILEKDQVSYNVCNTGVFRDGYPVNEYGETYGQQIYISDIDPDLIQVDYGDITGYIRNSDFDNAIYDPDSGIVIDTITIDKVPIYDSNGKNIIGYFYL